jgi:hypothetical protein
MFQGRKGLRWIVPSIALVCLFATGTVFAAPGDPLGGDDTGCAPTTKQGLSCGLKIHALLAKLKRAALVCHLTQDSHAFKNGSGTPGFANAEDNCEIGPSATSAKNKFDAKMAKLSILCDATVVANANARRDAILGNAATPGSLDSLNANAFCDATTGVEIDAGENIGFIPATDDNYKCSAIVAKLWSKLDYSVAKCHQRLAKYVWYGKPFDEDACEDVGVKSALTRYNDKVNAYVALGICPPCLADPMQSTNALALGANTVTAADTQLQEVFICPGP